MRTVLRRAAHAATILALLALGLRPTRREAGSSRDALLATPGASETRVRRLADSLGGTRIFAGADELRRDRTRPPVRRLHVTGWGLDGDAWREVDSIPVVFHPAPAAMGVSRASWPAAVALGERLVVDGAVTGLPGRAWVYLDDPSAVADSTVVSGDGVFRLQTLPRATGRHRYVLRVGAAAETLGVSVVAPPAWRVLILESAPSFETSVLRDWLAERRGAVAIRSAVSRGRFRTEFVNRERVALAPLSGGLLDQFDVVVVDGRALVEMPVRDRVRLRQAVENGLGVLVVPDTILSDPFFFGVTLAPVEGLDLRLVRPAWVGMTAPVTTPVAAEPYTLRPRFGVESPMEDGTGGVLLQVVPRGAGRVGLSLVTGTARWPRGGERDAYAAYWSRLLAGLARDHRAEDRWTIDSPGPWFVNRPVALGVANSRTRGGGGEGEAAIVVAPSGTRDSVFLAPDPLDPSRRRGVFWPREVGWHVIAESEAAFYAQSPAAWRARQSTERLDATARHVVDVGGIDPARPTVPHETTRPISPLWFFGVFLAAAAYLWSARRPG